MNFQRDVEVEPSPIPLTDLFDVYRRACGGTNCTSQQPSYFDLANAADDKYGPDDPRALTFRRQGRAYGVDF